MVTQRSHHWVSQRLRNPLYFSIDNQTLILFLQETQGSNNDIKSLVFFWRTVDSIWQCFTKSRKFDQTMSIDEAGQNSTVPSLTTRYSCFWSSLQNHTISFSLFKVPSKWNYFDFFIYLKYHSNPFVYLLNMMSNDPISQI